MRLSCSVILHILQIMTAFHSVDFYILALTQIVHQTQADNLTRAGEQASMRASKQADRGSFIGIRQGLAWSDW